MSPAFSPLSPMSYRWCAMPKGGTVTFDVEPQAVLEAVGWLLDYDPYEAHAPSLLMPILTPEQRASRQIAWEHQVGKAARPLVKWLKRTKRYERPFERMPLCLDREITQWLANYAPSANGGLFGSSARKPPAHKAPKSAAALLFFSLCRKASNRRMGRPRLSSAKVDERLVETSNLSTTTLWRMMKRAEKRAPDIGALLAAYTSKTP